MSDKEAICKCKHGRNSHKDNWDGICVGCPCPGFEPEDAAESLPPEPAQEHPRADCEGCNKPDCPCNSGEGNEGWMGMFSNNPLVPVEPLPVEAKEKCGFEWGDECMCGKDKKHEGRHICGQCEKDVNGVDEPKPTPPTRLAAARQLLPYIYPNSDEKSTEILALGLSQNVEGMGMIPLFYRAMEMQMELNQLKPQPDSSSISSEQTFEQWWATDPVWTTPSSLARAAWNTAKGQR
jgi:hypothetical protein